MSESLPIQSSEVSPLSYQAQEYKPDPKTWEEIKDDIFALHRSSFPEIEDLEQKLQRGFNDKDNTAVLLYDMAAGEPKKLIGYSFAIPMPYRDPIQRKNIPTAAIDSTVIEEGYRGKGLVGLLMEQMEEILRRRGYEQMERSVVTYNGYADKVGKHYGSRILQTPLSLRSDRKKFIIKL